MSLIQKLYDAEEKKDLEKFDQEAKANMKQMNNFSTILYSKFKKEILKI